MLTMTISFGQMGVNTTNPDSSSVLELKSIRRGFLMPRMTTSQRRAISSPANGLFVFDTDDKMFYFYDSTYVTPSFGWTGLSPWIFKDDRSNKDTVTQLFMRDLYTHPSVQSLAIGTSVVIGDTTTNAPNDGLFVKGETVTNDDVTVKGTIEATKFVGHGITPIGGIIMWSGTTEPDGWELCDGNANVMVNGIRIPDLTGRFIVGFNAAETDYNAIGKNGGSKTSEHLHNIDPPSMTITGGTHTHSGTTGAPSATTGIADCGVCGDTRAANTTHTHAFSTSAGGGTHSHEVDIEDFNSAGSSNTENRPPYYVLAYLIRVE